MHWELWDRQSANLIEELDSEEEALQAVREMLAVNSPDLIDELSIGATYDEGEAHDVELPPSLYGEKLKARLAEMTDATAAEASRKVHARIRKWLTEEGWCVRDVDDPLASFSVSITLPDMPRVNISQKRDSLDHVILSHHWPYADDVQSIFGRLPHSDLENVVWSIYRDLTVMGVDFVGLDTPSSEMSLYVHVYYDGLTKDALIRNIRLIVRALMLAGRALGRAVQEHNRSEDRAPSEAKPTGIVRFVPRTDGSLTLAG